MKFETTKKTINTAVLINIVDVILVLLLFILLASNFVTQSGISVKLPASSAQAQQNPKTVSVTLTLDNQVFVNDKPVSWDELGYALTLVKTADTQQVVYLRADKVTELQNVVRVMDIIKKSGYERIYIATQKVGTSVQ